MRIFYVSSQCEDSSWLLSWVGERRRRRGRGGRSYSIESSAGSVSSPECADERFLLLFVQGRRRRTRCLVRGRVRVVRRKGKWEAEASGRHIATLDLFVLEDLRVKESEVLKTTRLKHFGNKNEAWVRFGGLFWIDTT